MSRTQQDQFIDDDEEETCPLCVEEFDLSDRGFRPCPCGYQVCQFCYHNVRTNMNGLCPACRRPYDDSTIEFRKPSAEEEAAWKAKQSSRQKRTAVAQQKEVQKREADTANRKHLAGLRVVQKNLVYVTGLSPSVQEDRLLETLRGQQYFGQYGKIVKIVVSKAKDNQSSVGVYVTYARKEDAASCINAVDGSPNGERTLRAQFGTTKYCSAYLRNEQCQNRNCMFLHEPGEEKDSFTRQDLSSMNVASTQHQQSTFMPPQLPPQQAQPVAAAVRPDSTAPPSSQGDAIGPALPSTASWASKPHPPSRSVSRAAGGSAAAASPALTNATTISSSVPEPTMSLPAARPPRELPPPAPETRQSATAPSSSVPAQTNAFVEYVERVLSRPAVEYIFDDSSFSEEQKKIMKAMPSLIDPYGGRKRRLLKMKLEEERRRQVEDQSQDDSDDQIQRSGSLQLGGEPETELSRAQQQADSESGFPLEHDLSQLSLINRGMTPTQQQLLAQRFKSSPTGGQSSGQTQQFANHFGQSNPTGHARNASRFSFANDSSSTTAVKPVANAKLMNQQSAMMPQQTTGNNSFGQQSSFYASTVPHPPPGLKTTGTPPVSGGGMFGQGHGFATGGLSYGSNMASRNSNDEMMREIYRRRELGGQDAGKHANTAADPFVDPAQHPTVPRLAAVQGRATPPIPPGLEGLGFGAIAAAPRVQPSVGTSQIDLRGSGAAFGTTERPTQDDGKLSSGVPSSAPAIGSVASHSPTELSIVPPETSPSKQPKTQGPEPSVSELKSQSSEATNHKRDIQATTGVGGPTPSSKDATVTSTMLAQPVKTATKVPWQMISSDKSAAAPSTSLDPTPSEANKHVQASAIPAALAKGMELDISRSRAQSPSTQPSTRAASPTSIADAAGKKRVHTIRVVSTPKTEIAPVMTFPTALPKMPSRNPSIASAQVPGTPTSEHTWDAASMTSASISRPSSPPPSSIVGSAAVRTKTKSQAKKERQERARLVEVEKKTDGSGSVDEGPVQEAILGRKKKAKKASTTPKAKPKPELVARHSAEEPAAELDPEPAQTEDLEVTQIEDAAEVEVETVSQEPPEVTPSSVISEICANSKFLSSCLEAFLRPLTQANAAYKSRSPIAPADMSLEKPFKRHPDVYIDPERLAPMLTSQQPYTYGEEGRVWTHGCISPLGAHLRHLEQELEERFLSLEKDNIARPQQWRYRHTASTDPDMAQDRMVGLRLDPEDLLRVDLDPGSVRGGGPQTGSAPTRDNNAMEKAVEEGSKKGSFLVGNAEGYINEFVLPVRGGGRNASANDGLSGGNGREVDDLAHYASRHSTDELLRLMEEAKKLAEEKEAQLRKVIKKNRKLMGLTH